MDETIPLLKTLIGYNTASLPKVNEAMEFCREWLEGHGLTVQKYVNNGHSMLVCEVGNGSQTLVFNGHLDVVKGKEEQFAPYEKDAKLYGRGSADMKAGLAAMMAAMVRLNNAPPDCKVQLQIVPDEETGGRNGTGYLVDHDHKGDFVICGEPTGLGIAIQSKGVLQLDITVSGSSTHGSRPWEGENAIEKAFALYQRIKQLPFSQERSELYAQPSINLAKIQAGTVYNKVPAKCDFSLDIRYLPDQLPEDILQQINSLSDDKVAVHICNDPVNTEVDNPYVKTLSEAVTRNTQLEKVNIFGQHGSSDGQYFTVYGVPAVEFGPVGYNWHGDNELVYTSSIPEYENILVDFAGNFANVKPPVANND
ncbi:M20 family metallopeptidase [Marinococcus halophilus]|uniref:M20 family metallopeptidase n=1 Tax=Marinococcus halophilus TaxID=1371 RepID=UPI0009A8B0EB|nr:M20/M25/M40 family metallo-hydrolase [Marinococcus halophilus]